MPHPTNEYTQMNFNKAKSRRVKALTSDELLSASHRITLSNETVISVNHQANKKKYQLTFNEWPSPSLSLKRVLAKEVSWNLFFEFSHFYSFLGRTDTPPSQHVDVDAKVTLPYVSWWIKFSCLQEKNKKAIFFDPFLKKKLIFCCTCKSTILTNDKKWTRKA